MNGRSLSSRHRQQGITLIVALVMLLVIGMASVGLMRSSLNTDTVANNARVQTLANEAAQIGLRYCENQMLLVQAERPAGFVVYTDPAGAGATRWSTLANWRAGVGKLSFTLPSSAMQSGNSTFVPARLPECMVELDASQLAAGVTTAVVTARGFSPDYAEDSNGHVTAGSVVWLQSTNRVN